MTDLEYWGCGLWVGLVVAMVIDSMVGFVFPKLSPSTWKLRIVVMPIGVFIGLAIVKWRHS